MRLALILWAVNFSTAYKAVYALQVFEDADGLQNPIPAHVVRCFSLDASGDRLQYHFLLCAPNADHLHPMRHFHIRRGSSELEIKVLPPLQVNDNARVDLVQPVQFAGRMLSCIDRRGDAPNPWVGMPVTTSEWNIQLHDTRGVLNNRGEMHRRSGRKYHEKPPMERDHQVLADFIPPAIQLPGQPYRPCVCQKIGFEPGAYPPPLPVV